MKQKFDVGKFIFSLVTFMIIFALIFPILVSSWYLLIRRVYPTPSGLTFVYHQALT
jgi:hypothetical protein